MAFEPGDTVVIKDGVYSGQLELKAIGLRKAQTPGGWTVKAQTPGGVRFNTPAGSGAIWDWLETPQPVVVEGLVFAHVDHRMTVSPADLIEFYREENRFVFRDCSFLDAARNAVSVRGGAQVTLERCTVAGAKRSRWGGAMVWEPSTTGRRSPCRP